jgi:hypothetical protein
MIDPHQPASQPSRARCQFRLVEFPGGIRSGGVGRSTDDGSGGMIEFHQCPVDGGIMSFV